MSIKYSYDVEDPEFLENDFSEVYDDLRESIADAIPLDYSETHYGQNIHRVISLELERISAAMHVVKRNCFAHLADEDGIGMWEHMTGIPVDHADTLEQRRKYMQAKLTGRHIFFGYHFDAGLRMLGGPIRKYIYDPETAYASVKFVEPLSEDELRKIKFYCDEVGPAHIIWEGIYSPGAGDGWQPSKDGPYSAPWLRSDQEGVYSVPNAPRFTIKDWADLTNTERGDYCAAASAAWDEWVTAMPSDELDELYPLGKPDWMDSPPGPNDQPPPRYQEFI